MARIPNTDTANGLWKTNQLYRAKSGEVWPATHIPGFADGYITRCTSLDGGDSFGRSSYFNHWGSHRTTQGYCGLIAMRCTTNDWVCQGASIGTYVYSATHYLQWGVWAGTTNDTAANAIQWSGNNTHTIAAEHSNYICRSTMMGIGPNQADGTERLTQNTWYTIGFGAWQTGGYFYTAYSGGGHTNYRTSRSDQMTGSGPGGMTITPTFEWASASRNGQNHEYFDSPLTMVGRNDYGPLSAFKVKVFD